MFHTCQGWTNETQSLERLNLFGPGSNLEYYDGISIELLRASLQVAASGDALDPVAIELARRRA